MAALKSEGVPYGISITATSRNVDLLLQEDFYDHYFRDLGISYLFQFQTMPVGRGKEVIDLMYDLRRAGCDILVLGQYLAPTSAHYPVREFINIEQFETYAQEAERLGFRATLASPLARTSYQAKAVFAKVKQRAGSFLGQG